MKTLTLVTSVTRPSREEMQRLEAADESPRILLYEDRLGSDILDAAALQRLPLAKRLVRRPVVRYVAQVLQAYARRKRYDAVLSWGEPLSLLFAALLKLTASPVHHVALMYWMSPPKKALLLRLLNSRIDQIITWSSVQRQIAIDQLGIPASKIRLVAHPVDQRFWRPMPGEGDMIAAVGNEMRDYGTLIRAMRELPIRCHIAARDDPYCVSRKLATIGSVLADESRPWNVTVGERSYPELRALYARSRFVVIPLHPTDTDNGVRTALESMAMGKAVICSRVRGQVDVIEDGVTGLLVPQGDPGALREAIQYLWDHPEVAERMGHVGRRCVEERHTFDEFVEAVRRVVEDVVAERQLAPA